MSGDVITLDGLSTGTLGQDTAECGKLVPINAPMLGKTIQVCETDVKRIAGMEGQPVSAPRRRGRPKNSTVKNGARRPNFKECKTTKVVVTKSGRKICMCADKGNGQILAGAMCNLPKPKKGQ
jgi:hypothetical protein